MSPVSREHPEKRVIGHATFGVASPVLQRRAVSATSALVAAIVVVAAVGVLLMTEQSNAGDSPPAGGSAPSAPNSVSTIIINSTSFPSSGSSTRGSSSTTSECYGGPLPANGSSSSYTTTVFNVTRLWDSWSWPYISSFTVGSYLFNVTNPGANPSANHFQLEPQLLFNVTNGQGRIQYTGFTVLGSWDSQPWPPDISPLSQVTLFGGQVTLQLLFLCNGRGVLLEVWTQ